MLRLAVVLVLALAAFRAARLVAIDTLFLAWRERLYTWAWDDGASLTEPTARAPWRSYVYELFTCPHCLGVWFAVAAYCAWRWGGDVARAIIVVAAIAGAQSALASFTAKADD